MARLDIPLGVLRHPIEADACALCPDGGRGRADSFCPVLETPVCHDCCTRMLAGDAYRLLTAVAKLDGRDLGDLMRACMQCVNRTEAEGDHLLH